ncbi:MAG: SRPBCC family protein [Gammaproteobacteria bacterium]|nr:SRPBCC family protein [Gammaproteobacteria bacterium]MCP5199661.1 SRPBCC family protein [Gammaproteobacteria bacterium]
MRVTRGLPLLLLTVLLTPGADAGESERASIEFHGRSYTYEFSAVLDAPRDAVHAVVTDYDHLERVNDSITDSHVIERYGDGALKRLLALKECILMFCFDITFVEDLVESADGIRTTIIPAESTFRDGHAEWRLEALGKDRTRMRIRATQTPDFWIPPLLGPLVLKRVFLREIRETSANIERLARASAAG